MAYAYKTDIDEEDIGGEIKRLGQAINSREATAQADSVAADLATLVTDFNALLAKLRAAGLMAT